ncbi:ATPase [[Phormidium ambiguum] IAM M-71]|uniref:ATPase n=1 Tax=[Phormidium ambiguum] IAM M-71 TaxID=454136 RepID=A0A1U7IHM6_9CYAN|nr:NB-ARC domain-containing protein [Phormidium ambiguum]OKH36554.1 ATPase [Phormidium ambiguum IAM M-71]
MDISEILQLADEVIFIKTGQHLDYLQEAILRGTLQGQKYWKIAEETHASEGHIRDVASELWKVLSDVMGERVSKSSFRTKVEQSLLSNVASPFGKNILRIGNVNICPQNSQTSQPAPKTEQTSTQPHIDLGDAPEIFSFFDRTTQLTTLETWILQQHSRLIAILGISGIGKTTLSLKLIEQIKHNFEYIIYRSLRFSPTLETTLTNLLQIFAPKSETPQNIETQLSQLINYLRQHRCLIILDDIHTIFSSKQLAGQYQTGYENYHLFFKLITQVNHQSCLIVNSWEKPREVAQLKKENNAINCLLLEGLGETAKKILREQELLDEECWQTLIDKYQGNPLWLEFTSHLIKELFAGKVSEFLQCDTLILSESLQAQLDQQFQRLTPEEIAVMIQLANENEPVTLADLIKNINLPTSELLNAIQSLGMRLLLDTKEEDRTRFFSLNAVLKQYIKNRYTERNNYYLPNPIANV